jgi:hypothetical protein
MEVALELELELELELAEGTGGFSPLGLVRRRQKINIAVSASSGRVSRNRFGAPPEIY